MARPTRQHMPAVTAEEVRAYVARSAERHGITVEESRASLEQAAWTCSVPVEYVVLADKLEREAPDLAAEVKAGRRRLVSDEPPPLQPDAATELRRRQACRAPVPGRLF
jgi:hypothetical protein